MMGRQKFTEPEKPESVTKSGFSRWRTGSRIALSSEGATG